LLVVQCALAAKAQCQQMVFSNSADSQEQVFELCLPNRDVVLCPVSNGQRHEANSGSHWSLLVLTRARAENPKHCCFAAHHFDSLKSGMNAKRAKELATAVLHGNVAVENGQCARQTNSYDCGVYLLYFMEIIVQAYLASYSWFSFQMSKKWREQLASALPRQISCYRGLIVKKYQADAAALHVPAAKKTAKLPAAKKPAKPPTADKPAKPPAAQKPAQPISASKKRPASSMSAEVERATRGKLLRRRPRGSSKPHDWGPSYSTTAKGEQKKPTLGKVFRRISQPDYPAIMEMSEAASERCLVQYKLLPMMRGRFC
jgi:hypothetical protein